MPRAPRPLVFLAGGGTVGHLAPGFAVRAALRDLGGDAVFVTPGEEREAAWFPPGDPTPLHVRAPKLPRRPAQAAAFPFRMGRAVVGAWRRIRQERPAAVVALGGWPCAPTALAALFARLPLCLVATDAVPGVVVRALHRFAQRTYVATDEGRDALPRRGRVVVVGRMIRPEVRAARRDPARFGLGEGRRTLFVVGGSLGARALNRATVDGIVEAVDRSPDLPARLQVIHSTGPADDTDPRRVYEALGIPCHVSPYVRDVGTAYATADLVLCRGGASTVAEVEWLGVPAVIVPFPHHKDRQQWKNAAPLVGRGAAVLLAEAALTPEAFRTQVVDLLFDDRRLEAMAKAARRPRPADRAGRPGEDAAATIATDLVRFIGGRRRGRPRTA
jgi:UDP-N-acetylglucosamine--N-acetylmuramyl-(pentapeptide) pyrophosphoryl-undecaprenol N-acetylglucosamine transferase